MKILYSVLALILFLPLDAMAITRNYYNGSRSSSSSNTLKTKERRPSVEEIRKKEADEKKAAKAAFNRANQISVKKVKLPEGATHPMSGKEIESGARIESLCGYELGSVVRLSASPKVDKEGNVVVEEKLKKPYRLCDKAILKYSNVNNALYSISIYSEGDPELDNATVAAETEAIQAGLAKKFADKVTRFVSGRSDKNSTYAVFAGVGGQNLIVKREQVDCQKKGTLKGSKDGKVQKGWSVSVTLEDEVIKNLGIIGEASVTVDSAASDLDAL